MYMYTCTCKFMYMYIHTCTGAYVYYILYMYMYMYMSCILYIDCIAEVMKVSILEVYCGLSVRMLHKHTNKTGTNPNSTTMYILERGREREGEGGREERRE